MSKAFSVASWNVEHFKPARAGATEAEKKKVKERAKRVMKLIKAQKPDVIAIYEVEGKESYELLFEYFPKYNFHITEGLQTQEILLGVRNSMSSFFTQKTEFKSGSPYLRPGALLTLFIDNEYYPVLFLHTKSGPDPKGFGLRDDMFYRALQFRSALNKVASNPNGSNFLFLGDLNTMGMKYPYDLDVSAETEIKRMKWRASYYNVRQLSMTHELTWSNGSGSKLPDSWLDHVFASKHLQFKQFSGKDVKVIGWPEETTNAKKDKWIREHSDHALLFFEVQKV